MTIKKTDLMLRVQSENDNEPIETLVPRVVREKGLSQAASGMGISKGSLTTWLLKLGYSYYVEYHVEPLVPVGAAGPPDG